MSNKGLVSLNIGLVIAVLILFVLHFSGGSEVGISNSDESDINVKDSLISEDVIADTNTYVVELPTFQEGMKIAFVNSDSVNRNYKYLIDLENTFTAETKKAQNSLERRIKKFQKKVTDFQAEVNIMGQMEIERRTEELNQRGAAIQNEEMEIAQLQQKLEGDLIQQNQKIQIEFIEKTSTFFNALGQELGYDYVVAYQKGVNTFLYANPKYDITSYVIEKLNADYESNKSKSE